jgi:hypothetical protein
LQGLTNSLFSTESKSKKESVLESNITEIYITPARAKEILESNTRNRRVKNRIVERYAADMKDGRWKTGTYELIKISKSGVVLDGQHRLHSVIRAGVTIKFQIVFGVDDDVFDVLDTGSRRNAPDTFSVAGINGANTIPSIIQTWFVLNCGTPGKNVALTNTQRLEEYNNDPEFWYNVSKRAAQWYHAFAKMVKPSFIGGYYALFAAKDGEMAESFMNQVFYGKGIENETINVLRNRIIHDYTSNKKLSATHRHALFIKAWNAYRKGVVLKVLQFDPEKQEFPTAI